MPTTRKRKPAGRTARPTVRTAHCPACRQVRPARPLGTATVAGQQLQLLRCTEAACELIWAIRCETGRTSA